MAPCNRVVAFKLERVMWDVDSTIHDKDLHMVCFPHAAFVLRFDQLILVSKISMISESPPHSSSGSQETIVRRDKAGCRQGLFQLRLGPYSCLTA